MILTKHIIRLVNEATKRRLVASFQKAVKELHDYYKTESGDISVEATIEIDHHIDELSKIVATQIISNLGKQEDNGNV